MMSCQEAVPKNDPIIGGQTVSLSDPDQKLVVMLKILRSSGESICTATLISDRVLLTAAHCVDRVEPKNIIPVFKTNTHCPVNHVREAVGEVIEVISHKKFDGTPQSFSDLAVLLLNNDAPADQLRIPILTSDKKIKSTQALLIGYGITNESNKDSQTLRRIYKKYPDEFVQKDSVYVIDQTENSGGFCRGDSGAPIIVSLWGEPYILAVNSANIGKKPNTECQTASLAINVQSFDQWIHDRKTDLEKSTWFSRLFFKSSTE